MPNKPDRLTAEQISRLREALLRKQWTVSHLAREMGVRVSSISDNLNGKTGPQPRNLTRMCELLEVNEGYVVLGLEPKWRSASQTKLRPVAASLGIDWWLTETAEGRGTTAEERELLRTLRLPDPYARNNEAYQSALEIIRDVRASAEKSRR